METKQDIRLNIGAGDFNAPGFISHDIKDGKPAFPLDYPDGSVSEVYASHVLEHLSGVDTQKALAEWKRVLKPGGRLRIAVPDFDKIYQQRKMNNTYWERYLMGGQTDENDFHKSAFNEGKLRSMLEIEGWENIGGWEPEFRDTASHPISLRVQAFKADPSRVPLRLNIGGGSKVFPGFTNFDIENGDDATKPMPFADNSVDEIYSSHTLEHIHHSKTHATLKEWVRILKPGGRISIAVPDWDAWNNEYVQGKVGIGTMRAFTHGDTEKPIHCHKTLFNKDSLLGAMRLVGIGNIREFEPLYADYSAMPNSLNLTGEKHDPKIKADPKVMIVMSVPRIGFMECMTACMSTCRETGWEHLDWGTSGDWHSSLTFAMEAAIEQGADYAFVIDYDSVFTADDAKEMLRLMQAHPEAAAIYPVQVHRHMDSVLGFDKKYDYSTGEVTDVDTGHFACTMVRLSCLKEVPHPWFMAFPDPVTGKWKQNHKLDADISFWLHLKLAGFTVYQANNVHIGHIELGIRWTGPNGVFIQPLPHYRKFGKPKNLLFDGDWWKKNPTPAATADGADLTKKRADGSLPKPAEPALISEAKAIELIGAVNQVVLDDHKANGTAPTDKDWEQSTMPASARPPGVPGSNAPAHSPENGVLVS